MRKAGRRGLKMAAVPKCHGKNQERRGGEASGSQVNEIIIKWLRFQFTRTHTYALTWTHKFWRKKNCQTSRKRRCFLFVPIYVAFQDTPIRKRNFLFSPDFHRKITRNVFRKKKTPKVSETEPAVARCRNQLSLVNQEMLLLVNFSSLPLGFLFNTWRRSIRLFCLQPASSWSEMSMKNGNNNKMMHKMNYWLNLHCQESNRIGNGRRRNTFVHFLVDLLRPKVATSSFRVPSDIGRKSAHRPHCHHQPYG